MTFPLLTQLADVDRIPAVSPLHGVVWTWVVPIALFLVTFAATWLLYRRFSRD